MAEGYDGNALWFKVSEEEAKNSFVKDSAPTAEEYSKYKTSDIPSDIDPVMVPL